MRRSRLHPDTFSDLGQIWVVPLCLTSCPWSIYFLRSVWNTQFRVYNVLIFELMVSLILRTSQGLIYLPPVSPKRLNISL